MTDTNRTAFEAHFHLSSRQAKKDNAGCYIDEKVRDKWEGWQAAMGAKRIPLDGWQIVAVPDGWTDVIDTAMFWADMNMAAPKEDMDRIAQIWRKLASAPKP